MAEQFQTGATPATALLRIPTASKASEVTVVESFSSRVLTLFRFQSAKFLHTFRYLEIGCKTIGLK